MIEQWDEFWNIISTDTHTNGTSYKNWKKKFLLLEVGFVCRYWTADFYDENRIHNFWMSDEAYFHRSDFVNKQNFRY